MHFPLSKVHLTMDERSVPVGQIYCVPIPDRCYEKYHMVTEDMQYDLYDDEFFGHTCNCDCNNCNGCTAKKELLPNNYFVMAVEDDLYKRVLDEVSASSTMPCGLFFCGHHEDVHRPSVVIAVCLVVCLLASMGAVAYVSRG